MNTLIYTSLLGIGCMLAEVFNLRKVVLPLCIIGLLAILGLNYLNLDFSLYSGPSFNMVVVDTFSMAFSSLLILLTILIIALSGNFYKAEGTKLSDYLSIIVFTLCGAIALVSFGNMAMFFLGLEVLSISLYILAGSKRKDVRSNEAGMKYFLMGSFASGILLFGIALIYGETGTFDILAIGDYVHSNHASILFYIGAGLILIALLFKVSAVPFHFWAPDVYDGSPTLITLLMATVAKIAAFAAFYRLFSICFPSTFMLYGPVLSVVTILTITVGNFTALNQDSFKRMLAFSGISNAGYLMMGITSLTGGTSNAIFYYALAYGVASIAAFAVAILVFKNVGSDKITAFNGLGKKNPLLAAALTIAMLSMGGIPPLAGFFGKYYIFSEAIREGHIVLTIIAVINSIVSIYYYFKVMMAMYTKSSDEGSASFEVPMTYAIVIGLSVLLMLVAGIFPQWFSQLI